VRKNSKHWERRVATGFRTPFKRAKRHNKRVEKGRKLFPRPLRSLQPVVHSDGRRYNLKKRLGRGFSAAEVKAAGFKDVTIARRLGIRIDPRRRNKSQESLKTNTDRLKAYKKKLVVYTKGVFKTKKELDKTKKRPAGPAMSRNLLQKYSKVILPIHRTSKKDIPVEFVKLKQFAVKESAFQYLRAQRAMQKTIGERLKLKEKQLAENKTKAATA